MPCPLRVELLGLASRSWVLAETRRQDFPAEWFAVEAWVNKGGEVEFCEEQEAGSQVQ